jgi:hypothetical protein
LDPLSKPTAHSWVIDNSGLRLVDRGKALHVGLNLLKARRIDALALDAIGFAGAQYIIQNG